MGEPWAGETWSCARCGKSGEDKDTLQVPPCLPREGAHVSLWYHELDFAPPAHARALLARTRREALAARARA